MFTVDLAPAPSALEACRAQLNAEELERAGRFTFDVHRHRYIVGRAQARRILAGYLGAAPADVAFEALEHGKPVLAGDEVLQFNFSRSEDLGLVAVCTHAEVGVDVEAVRAFPETEGIVERFFSAEERAAFAGLAGSELDATFFRCWTRKEALLKSTGHGLTYPLHAFSVSTEESPGPTQVGLETEGGTLERWLLDVPAPQDGFVASVAVADGPRNVECFRWA